MATVGVIHLVRAGNGIEPFERFADSYERNRGGLEHELTLVYKGFGSATTKPYDERLAGAISSRLHVRDFGFDIRAYLVAARSSSCRYLCFLNSFSVLLDRDWLAKLVHHVEREGVGIVSATGSWESHASDPGHPRRRSPVRALAHYARARWLGASFPPFPNPHVRTNAFVLRRETLLSVSSPFLLTKMSAHRFESGRGGLTRQVEAAGLRALVVGRDGHGYEKQDWPRSATFRAGDQMNLLVADNQTRAYESADPELRRRLEVLAWGGP